MRITLVISSLEAGGAERVMSLLANYWAEQGRHVTLITLGLAKQDFYALHPAVHRVELGLTISSRHVAASVWNNMRRLKRLRQEIRASQPDVVLSFVDTINILTLASMVGLRVPVIVSERTDPRHHSIGFAWTGLRALLYPYAAALVVQTDAVRDWAKSVVNENAIYIVPNPLKPVLNGSEYSASRDSSSRTLVAIGRLNPEKGFDLLLQALARCAAKHPAWSLVILGEGQERRPLEALVAKLGLKDRVSLPGRVEEPVHTLHGADLFVLASRYEGFPNALLEAMACGLAVISTDCASGPRTIIRDGLDGVLVPPNDVEALAMAMDRLMADPAERQRLGSRAVEIVDRFSIRKIMIMWDDLFLKVCEGRTHA